MNAPIRIAQTGTTQSANQKVTVVTLEKPASGQAITVKTGFEGKVKLDFSKIADERITIVRVGETAIIFFHDNKSTITLDPFFGSDGLPLAALEFDLGGNRIFTAEQIAGILPFSIYQGILPAAGEGGGDPQNAGANFLPPGIENFPPIVLNLLMPPEDPNTIEFGILETAALDDPLPSMSFAGISGLVEEEHISSALPAGLHPYLSEGNEDGNGTPAEDEDTSDSGAGANLTTQRFEGQINITGGSGSFTFALLTGTALPVLESVGQPIVYDVDTAAGILTGYVDSGAVAGSLDSADRVVFTLEVSASGLLIFTIYDQLDHPDINIEDILGLDFSGLIEVTDTVTALTLVLDGVVMRVIDDVPIVSQETEVVQVYENDIATPWSLGTSPFDGNTEFNGLVNPAIVTGNLQKLVKFGSDEHPTGDPQKPVPSDRPMFAFIPEAALIAHMEALGLFSKQSVGPAQDDGIPLVFSYSESGDWLILSAAEPDEDGVAPDTGNPVFELRLNQFTGDYEFRLFDELIHALPPGFPNGSDTDIVLRSGDTGIDFGQVIVAIDYDGDTVPLSEGQFVIQVVDDVPEAKIKANHLGFVQHDETPGVQGPSFLDPFDSDTNSNAVKALFAVLEADPSITTGEDPHIPPASGAIGYARSFFPVVFGNVLGLQTGADAPAAQQTFSLGIVGGPGVVDSGLRLTDGSVIVLELYDNGTADTADDLIIGRVTTQGGAVDYTGQIAFAIAIESDGRISIAQYLSLRHPAPGSSHDEHVSLAGKISVTLTIMDSDGDVASDSVEIGSHIRFDDDGPKVTITSEVSEDERGQLRLDFDESVQPDGGDDDTYDRYNTGETESLPTLTSNGGADDVDTGGSNYNQTPVVELNPDSSEAIGALQTSVAGGLIELFNININYGADGGHPDINPIDSFRFDVTGDGKTNLVVTALDGTALEGFTVAQRTIYLVEVSNTVIEGRVIGLGNLSSGDEYVAFRISIVTDVNGDPQIKVEHFLPIDHDASDFDGIPVENPSVFDENVELRMVGSSELRLVLSTTATDGDDDTATGSGFVQLVTSSLSFISFDDDGPTIEAVDAKECGVVQTYSQSTSGGNWVGLALDGAGDRDLLVTALADGPNQTVNGDANDLGAGGGQKVDPGEMLRLDFVFTAQTIGNGPGSTYTHGLHYGVDSASFTIAQIQGNPANTATVFVRVFNTNNADGNDGNDGSPLAITAANITVTNDIIGVPPFTITEVYSGATVIGIVISGLDDGARVTINTANEFNHVKIENYSGIPFASDDNVPPTMTTLGGDAFSIGNISSTLCLPITIGVTHDESAGFTPQSGPNPENDVDPATAPAALTTAIGALTVLGYAKSTGTASVLFGTPDFGTDGPQSGPNAMPVQYIFSTGVAGQGFDGEFSGLTATMGGDINLYSDPSNPSIVWGVANGDLDNGDRVFALYLDDAGFLWVAQFLAIAHSSDGPTAAHHDDIASILPNLIYVAAVVTDGDGDKAYAVSINGLSIDFNDDGPTAQDDTFTQSAENAAVTGSVLADNGNGVDVFGADGLGTVTLVPNSLSSTDPNGPGSLTLNADGTFIYTPAAGEEGTVTFDYQITDGDGDTSIATVTINLEDDSAPRIVEPEDLVLDEDGFAFANDDTTTARNDETDSTESLTDSGSVTVNFGNDMPADPLAAIKFLLTGLNNQLQTLDGQNVTFALSNSDRTLTGSVGGGTTEVIVITITGQAGGVNDIVYSYSAELKQPLKHVDGNIENTAMLNNVTFQVTDSDNTQQTGTFNVSIVDDVPQATNGTLDLDMVQEGSSAVVIGTVAGLLANDAFGADGQHPTTPITITNPGSQGGTVTIDINGNLLYTPTVNAPPGATSETFTYTIMDGDGDTSTATFTIRVTDTGVTNVVASPDLLADEDDIPSIGNNDSAPGDDDPVLTGTITYDLGLDTIGSVTLSTAANATGLQTLANQNVVTIWDGTDTLIGYIDGSDPTNVANRVFTITISNMTDTGADYTMVLLKPVKHTVNGTEDNTAPFTVNVLVTDSDGSTGNTTFSVVIDDDMPKEFDLELTANTVTHDETEGLDSTDTNAVPGPILARFATIALPVGNDPHVGANPIGYAVSAGPLVAIIGGAAFGADGPASSGSNVQKLVLGDADLITGLVDSGLDTTEGDSIYLFLEGNPGEEVVVGRVGNALGEAAFAITLDQTTSLVYVVQFLSIFHDQDGDGTGGTHDEPAAMIAGALKIEVTLTDGDGDQVTSSINIGASIVFEDDGPSIQTEGGAPVLTAVLDETQGLKDGDGNAEDDDVAGLSLVPPATPIGETKILAGELESLFDGKEFGADGPLNDDEGAATSYSLTNSTGGDFNGTPTGLTLTGVAGEIKLFTNGSVIEGWTGATIGTGTLAFAIGFNAGGDIVVQQFAAIFHTDLNNNHDFSEFLDDLVYVKVTITDGDGDTAFAISESALSIEFQDDGPVAALDTGNITEGGTLDVNAANGVLQNDTEGADGAAIAGVRAAGGDTTTPVTGGLNTAITGLYGTLTLQADGSYKYESTADTIIGNEEDVFVYTLVDGDGDTSTTTLTIHLADVTLIADDQTKTVDEAALDLDEDGDDLAAGSVEGSDPTSTDETVTGQLTVGGTGVTYALLTGGNAVTAGNRGSIQLNSDGSWTYTLTDPFDNADADDGAQTIPNVESFTYVATDGNGNTVQGTITIDVIDDVPTARADEDSVPAGETITEGNVLTGVGDGVGTDALQADTPGADGATVTGVAAGDVGADVDGDVGTSIVTSKGTLVLNADGSYTYTASGTGVGDDVFTYTVTDGDGDKSTTTLTITIENTTPEGGGSVSLTLDEAALDLFLDPGDLAAGSVTGTNPSSPDETDQVNTGITFTATGESISIGFADPLGSNWVAPTVGGLAAGFSITWALDGAQLVGTLMEGATNHGVAIRLALTGETTATPGNTATPTVTATLTGRLEHAAGNGDVTITGIVVVATDFSGDVVTGTVDLTVLDDAPTLTSITNAIIANESGLTLTGYHDGQTGADSAGQYSISGTAPTGLTYYTFTNADGTATLVASTVAGQTPANAGAVTNQYFVIDVNTNGTYDLTLVSERPVTNFPNILGTFSQGTFTTIGLPEGSPTPNVVFDGVTYASGAGGGDTAKNFVQGGQDGLNVSTGGFGIHNPNMDDNEGFIVFVQGGANSLTFDINRTGGGAASTVLVTWAAYVGGAPTSGQAPSEFNQQTKNFASAGTETVTIDPNVTFDYLVVRFDIGGGGNHRVQNFSYGQSVVPQDQLLDFQVTLTDSDGDQATSDFSVKLSGGAPGAADTLTGTSQDDVLQGGLGNDNINGGDGFDIVDFTGVAGNIVADLSGADPIQVTINGGNADLLSNVEGLVGGSGNDTFTGDGGANYLDGAGGLNSLTGGGGADTFAISQVGVGHLTTITDYTLADNDVIDLTKLFEANPGNIDEFVTYNSGAGELFVDLDGSGGAHASVQAAQLTNFPPTITIVYTDGENRFELTA